MVRIPAYCEKCDLIFTPSGINISNSTGAALHGNITNCPRCGRDVKFIEGVFNERGQGLEIVSAPRRTHDVLQRLREIAERAKSGEISPEQAIEEAREVAPELAPHLNLLIVLGLPLLAIFLQLISLYMQHADSRSTDAFEAEALKLMQEQTEILRRMEKRQDIVGEQHVHDEGAAPTEPKAATKAVVPKKKSKRRADVRKARKKQLVQQRENSGRRYRSADGGENKGKRK